MCPLSRKAFCVFFFASALLGVVKVVDPCENDTNLHGKSETNCSHQSLTAVPDTFIPKGTEILLLNFNHFKTFSTSSFKGLLGLTKLDLSNNDLTKLDMSHSLPLEELNLSNNSLTEFPKLRNFKKLTKIYLAHNSVGEIPDEAFRGLNNLKEIDLHRNQITFLSEQVFQHLSNLETLDLSYNQLRSLPSHLVSDLNKMDTFYLSWNRLTELPDHFFEGLDNLAFVYLHNNPWNCNCTLEYLKTWVEDNDYIIYIKNSTSVINAPESVTCSSPRKLQGTPVQLFSTDHCIKSVDGVEETTPELLTTTERMTQPTTALLTTTERMTQPTTALLTTTERMMQPTTALLTTTVRMIQLTTALTEPTTAIRTTTGRLTEPTTAVATTTKQLTEPTTAIQTTPEKLTTAFLTTTERPTQPTTAFPTTSQWLAPPTTKHPRTTHRPVQSTTDLTTTTERPGQSTTELITTTERKVQPISLYLTTTPLLHFTRQYTSITQTASPYDKTAGTEVSPANMSTMESSVFTTVFPSTVDVLSVLGSQEKQVWTLGDYIAKYCCFLHLILYLVSLLILLLEILVLLVWMFWVYFKYYRPTKRYLQKPPNIWLVRYSLLKKEGPSQRDLPTALSNIRPVFSSFKGP